MEYEGKDCFIPSGIACFLKCTSFIFRKDFSKEYFEVIQSDKRITNVMTRWIIPEFCERYKLDSGLYILKSKRILPLTVKESDVCLHIHKNQFFLFGRIEEMLYLLE